MKYVDIAEGTYGEATPAITKVIALAESLEWFLRSQHEARLQCEELVYDHLRLAQGDTNFIDTSRIALDLVDSNLSDAAALYRQLNSVGFGDDHARGVWRKALGEVVARVHDEPEQPQFRALIEPPQFPIAGKAGILGGMLAASRETLVFTHIDNARSRSANDLVANVRRRQRFF